MRDSQLPDEPESEDEADQEGPQGRLRPTGPGALTAAFLVGLVVGRLLPVVVEGRGGIAPRVGWLAVLALFFVAAILGYVAWSTYRTVHRERRWLQPNHAVNRLVLAKSCALVGALVAGGYLGYAVNWIGQDGPLERERLTHSLLAALGGVLIVAASLALERACRVGGGQKRP